jgi:hypothetical protein
MTLLEIFEKVNLIIPLEQRRFFNYFNDTVNELNTLYDGFVLEADCEEFTPAQDLSDSVQVLPLYHNSIVDNIIYMASQDASQRGEYKGEFIRKSRLAYLKYWRDDAKGKRVKRMRW